MDHSAVLHLTEKGADEVAHRTCKLGIKLRSVLLFLQHPQSIAFTLQKSVFPEADILDAIDKLASDGFIVVEAPPAAAPRHNASIASPQSAIATPETKAADFAIGDDILLSEARFLLIDFCVDCFGMAAEKFTDDLRACKSVSALRAVLKELLPLVGAQKPEQLPALRDTIRAINDTA
ncbi:hypothetical protein [Propionivibrio dicarboxylicus]|uniref:Uncharacterized protein n=1 Tax=Propionivibrio dicarboxylicus TaxID=83767 RepID=A0A1G7YD13_9RHOO|nr:hypothetical protein [Propionivibrio dicarboxylicus]SDG94448.1 hypothetical protein SAMN05660652_00971 [Propionivibrio dicarboxylicus]